MTNDGMWGAGQEDDGSLWESLITATCARCGDPFRRTEERVIARSTPGATVVHARCASSHGRDAGLDRMSFSPRDQIDAYTQAAWQRARRSIGDASASARNSGYDASTRSRVSCEC
jgi:hypothetical protein